MAEHILHILGTAQPESTGMASIVRSLAQGLDPGRYRIHALFLAGDGPLVNLLERAGVPARVLNWKQGIRNPLGAWKFLRFLRSQRFSIVHIHFGGRAVVHLVRGVTKAKIIRHLHGRILEGRSLSPVSFSGRGVDAVVAVSESVARCVVDAKARTIYAGLPVPSETPSRQPVGPEIVIGTAGRLVELKGIEYLLSAVAALRHDFPNLRLEIAGAGPLREKLESFASQAGLGDRVKFLGWIDDIQAVLSRWDIFALPSLEEGFPIAALDAMAAGLPVVATKVGGVPELIEDGTTGWLVPPRDIESLASRLRVLVSDRELRVRMGAAGYARIRDHFSTAHMIENFERLYEELLSSREMRVVQLANENK